MPPFGGWVINGIGTAPAPTLDPITADVVKGVGTDGADCLRGAQTAYVAVGHCCESGDLLTPAPGEPEVLQPQLQVGIAYRRDYARPCSTSALLPCQAGAAAWGDLCVVDGAGAYCSSMCTKNYNSFPEAAEVMVALDGSAHLIRRRQPVEQIWANEVPYTHGAASEELAAAAKK